MEPKILYRSAGKFSSGVVSTVFVLTDFGPTSRTSSNVRVHSPAFQCRSTHTRSRLDTLNMGNTHLHRSQRYRTAQEPTTSVGQARSRIRPVRVNRTDRLADNRTLGRGDGHQERGEDEEVGCVA